MTNNVKIIIITTINYNNICSGIWIGKLLFKELPIW